MVTLRIGPDWLEKRGDSAWEKDNGQDVLNLVCCLFFIAELGGLP